MLAKSKAFSSFAVDDLTAARQFYSDVLGLEVSEVPEMDGLLRVQAGDQDVLVYAKDDYAPASYTVLNFQVDNIEETADGLAGLGVRFERYEQFGEPDSKGIYRGIGPAVAWFNDPAGNTMAIMQMD